MSRHVVSLNGPIFIVGTGRSGTHFLDRCLISHPHLTDLTGGKENQYIFRDVVSAATDMQIREKYSQRIIKKYRVLQKAAAPSLLVDQCHPSLWLSDSLMLAFPGAFFLGLIRNPMSVAYSTMHHGGVKAWIQNDLHGNC